MKTTELRELDAWIAFHVTQKTTSLIKINESNCWLVPRYSAEGDAAMAVLEKCAEKTSVSITKDADEKFSVEWWIAEPKGIAPIEGSRWHQIVTAQTLPLAICLFAKKLFNTKP